ncbi:nuclear pore complex-interacting protein family member A5 isoform X6 [Homo sapiens]|nr:nuclear pore complex-interacting protein family member A5 isoform X6 [Homo sapiens]XP_047289421.1 nuclear pore complex-interacting protein family member A5 isoform X6 [Homo sapiens]|eukprot:XP_011520638.1 nuclear pore complex-interacting protein family member A5 isoform X3 [Homo sapiens]
MVKLSIVLTPRFLSHDQGQLTKELQQHVKSVTCPCEYLRKVTLRNPGSSGRKERPEAGTGSWLGRTRNQVINTLADHRHRGTDFGGSPWLLIITVFLRSYKFAISLCTSYLCVSFLKTIFPSQNGHDGSTDVQQRARRSNCRRQEGIKIVLEDIFTLWRQVETKVRAKIRKMKVTTKVNRHDKINGKRKTAKEHLRKLSMKEREHGEKERQVSEAEENGKLDMKEIHTYMEMFQRAQALRRRAEDYYRCKITPSARKPLCNRCTYNLVLPGSEKKYYSHA